MICRAVEYGALHKDDIAHELMQLLIQRVDVAHNIIHEELVKAILYVDYTEIPFEDWRTPFGKKLK
jgi:hypothetical protein